MKSKDPMSSSWKKKSIPYTPYARLSIALRGWILFDKWTGERIYKFEIWERHGSYPKIIEKIKQRRYERYA